MATLAHPAQPAIRIYTPTPTPISHRVAQALIYVLLIVIGLILFTPFILAFLGTFKTDAEIIAYPPTFFPTKWLVENWPKLWNTDLGGVARPAGASSLGLVAGLFAFLVAFLIGGLSSEEQGKGFPRAIGLPVTLALAVAGGAAAAWYVGVRLGAAPLYDVSTGIAVTF